MGQKAKQWRFGENDFLIEADAADMTDKLAIVKEFSCGASRRPCVLFCLSVAAECFVCSRVRPDADVYPAFTCKRRLSG